MEPVMVLVHPDRGEHLLDAVADTMLFESDRSGRASKAYYLFHVPGFKYFLNKTTTLCSGMSECPEQGMPNGRITFFNGA